MHNPYAAPGQKPQDALRLPEEWGDPRAFREGRVRTEFRLRALAILMESVGGLSAAGGLLWILLILGLPVLMPSEAPNLEVTAILVSMGVYALLVGGASFLGGLWLERRWRGALLAGLLGCVALGGLPPAGFGFMVGGGILLLTRKSREVLSPPYRLVEQAAPELRPRGLRLLLPLVIFGIVEALAGVAAGWSIGMF